MLKRFEPNRPERFNLALIPYVKYLMYLFAIMGRKGNKCSLFAFTVTIKRGKDVSGRIHMAFSM